MTDREKLTQLLDDISYKQELSDYDLWDMREAAELIADFLIANGVTVQPRPNKQIRKAENCRYYTPNSFWGAGCLGTKEIDPCEGDKCERWKPKEE